MNALLTPEEWSALRLSFQVGMCAALAGLPPAIAVGYLLARGKFVGKWFVEVIVNLPLVLPPVVTGYLLLICFAPHGPLGSMLRDWLGVKIVFNWIGRGFSVNDNGFSTDGPCDPLGLSGGRSAVGNGFQNIGGRSHGDILLDQPAIGASRRSSRVGFGICTQLG